MPKRSHRRSPASSVFNDLGFSGREAENLRLRSELMIALVRQIQSERLTQAEAAALLGVSQPRVSDLVRGKIDRFSIDSLIAMLGAMGAQVRVAVRTRRAVA